MLKKFLSSTLCVFNSLSFGQLTNIPDANFEQALIDYGYDTGIPNGSVPTSNISNVTHLYLNERNISDLNGIQDFIGLEALYVGVNNLTEIDVSNNLSLKYLHVFNNFLDSINLTQNTQLVELRAGVNTLKNIDLSQNQLLENLQLSFTNISALDLSHNGQLKLFHMIHTPLYCLDLRNGNNIGIEHFTCYGNYLECIDVDDEMYATNTWPAIPGGSVNEGVTYSTNCNCDPSQAPSVGFKEIQFDKKYLVKVYNMLGIETSIVPNELLIFLYSDGSREKRVIVE